MCFGGGGNNYTPPPQVVYSGPSQEQIDQQNASLDAFAQQIAEQQAATAAQIQSQIDAANEKTAGLESQLAQESSAAELALQDVDKAKAEAAAMAGANYTPLGAYGVTASQTEAPNAETTKAITPKKKPKGALKIQPGAASAMGSGLNIGV